MTVAIIFILTLAGTVSGLVQATGVSKRLAALDQLIVPLGRQVSQIKSDAALLNRELVARGEASARPEMIPIWLEEQIDADLRVLHGFVQNSPHWPGIEIQTRWMEWVDQITKGYADLRKQNRKLREVVALAETGGPAVGERVEASKLAAALRQNVRGWVAELTWGIEESDKWLRTSFRSSDTKMDELKSWLQILIASVLGLSLLFLWVGERALRPLGELIVLAREISRRGLRKEDKSVLPTMPLTRDDEVSDLAREFHRMATALLERERTVESQKQRLEDQNDLLRQITALNSGILTSLQSAIIVTDLNGVITHANPKAQSVLGRRQDKILGQKFFEFDALKPVYGRLPTVPKLSEVVRPEPYEISGRTFAPRAMPLSVDGATGTAGMILILDDITDQLSMEQQLRRVEHLAAIGRMSAQVAHEVRNPLHSIGLEAEMATDLAVQSGSPQLRQSLQSILSSVDRLEAITENYLKLSKLSTGVLKALDLGEVLERVLAEYAPLCEAARVQVDWTRERGATLLIRGDEGLLEQALGNLLKNALQALENSPAPKHVAWRLGASDSGKVWVRIEDNGPGIPAEIRERIFEPFVTSKAQGTGLGLAFVKQVVEEHGAEIRMVPSRWTIPQGSGAAFEIVFPGAKPV